MAPLTESQLGYMEAKLAERLKDTINAPTTSVKQENSLVTRNITELWNP